MQCGTDAHRWSCQAEDRKRKMRDWTTVLESIRIWRNRGRPVLEPPPIILPVTHPTLRVPAEYLSLYTYLEHRYASLVVLTFEQIEALLGFALPASACTEPDWWTSAAVPTHRHSAAWTGAGRTAIPNLQARIVAFERTA